MLLNSKVRVDWQDDPQAENLMRDLGVTWELRNVSIDAIDWSESYGNGARIGVPIIQDSVESLGMAMRYGSKIPRPVVYVPNGRTLYVIASGNQRLNAYKEVGDHEQKVPCYFASFEDQLTFEVFLRVANTVHGVPYSPQDRREHAFYCVKRLGMKSADAARMFLVTEDTITNYVRAIETRVELDRARVPNVERLNQSHLHALARISDEKSKQLLANVATQYDVTGERLNQVAAIVDSAKSQTEKTKAIKSLESELKETAKPKGIHPGKNRVGRPRRDRLFHMLSQLAGFLESGIDGTGFTDLEQVQCDRADDKSKLVAFWKRVAVRMALLVE